MCYLIYILDKCLFKYYNLVTNSQLFAVITNISKMKKSQYFGQASVNDIKFKVSYRPAELRSSQSSLPR